MCLPFIIPIFASQEGVSCNRSEQCEVSICAVDGARPACERLIGFRVVGDFLSTHDGAVINGAPVLTVPVARAEDASRV